MHEQQATAPAEFRTDYEGACTPGFDHDRSPAALVFNPAAPPLSLAAAAQARADCLHMALDAWTTTAGSDSAATAAEVALSLEPVAQELRMLLAELILRLSRGNRQGASHG